MKKIITFTIILFSIFQIYNLSAYTTDELNSANNLAKKSIIKNHSDNPELYNLDFPVLRQEIALVSRRVSGVKENTSCKNIFLDVTATKPNNWVCKNIEALVENNLISRNKLFNPEKNISKSEALIMFVKSIGFIDFSIDPNSSKNWQEQIVDFAVQNEIVERFTDYNTEAKRGWIFKVADYSIKVKEKRVKAGLWRDKYSDEVKIPKENNNTYENNTEIYIEAESGKLSGAGKYTSLGKSSRGIEAYLGDGGATVTYEINLKKEESYNLFIRLSDDGLHSNGTRSATIKVNNKTIAYNHISEDTKGWKWFSLGSVTLKSGKNIISFKKNATTSAAFIMDAFKLVPGVSEKENTNEEYNALYEQNHNLINRCKQYKLTTYKGVNNLETYTCDSITNQLNLDYHWYDFNPDSDGTLYLTITNIDKKGKLELLVKNYGTLIGDNGAKIYFKVPNVRKGETISYRISGTKGTHYHVKVDFNKSNNDSGTTIGSCDEKYKNALDEIKEAREYNSKITNISSEGQYFKYSSLNYEPCSSQKQKCFDDLKIKYQSCAIGTSCYKQYNTEKLNCINEDMNCKEKAWCKK